MGTTAKNAMTYEVTGAKVNKGTSRRAIEAEMDRLGTPTILWFLTRRHKVGLLTLSNILTITYCVIQFLNQ